MVISAARKQANVSRYVPGDETGFYESYFLRANHPVRPLAFWIRYTLFSPRRRPSQAIGELWAVWFNGESGRNVAVKKTVPLADCRFDPACFDVQVGDAVLGPDGLQGRAASGGHHITGASSTAVTSPPGPAAPQELGRQVSPGQKSWRSAHGPFQRVSRR
jgi:hypothetical protein